MKQQPDLAQLTAQLTQLGLDPKRVAQHAARLKHALIQKRKPVLEIVDTCRIDNGGILAQEAIFACAALAPHRQPARHASAAIVAMVPAAGAASRYIAPLASLVAALEATPDVEAAKQSLASLEKAGALNWPLPRRVRALLADPERVLRLDAKERAALLADLQLPKSLMPCVKEGASFLYLKDLEHARLGGITGQMFVTPMGMSQVFEQTLSDDRQSAAAGAFGIDIAKSSLPTLFVEQGAALSTIRFRTDGTPWLSASGEPSLVPAGHGALARLIPEARQLGADVRAVFIRNIDNLMGIGAEATAATASFLESFRTLFDALFSIRSALEAADLAQAAVVARRLMALAPASASAPKADAVQKFLASLASADERALWQPLFSLFHTPAPAAQDLATLRRLYGRPLNLLGQVPNTGRDVGGTPCLVATPLGLTKVCLEVPHASDDDRQRFFENPDKATHFNPVFVVAEMPSSPDYYGEGDGELWLMAEKKFRGEAVVYHESVLYELLGNSVLANAAFIEVPRLIFNPHKALHDARDKSLVDWTS